MLNFLKVGSPEDSKPGQLLLNKSPLASKWPNQYQDLKLLGATLLLMFSFPLM
jgi:hypothetical protein